MVEAFLVIHAPEGERPVPIGSGCIGRGQNNQVVLAGSRISRQHALLRAGTRRGAGGRARFHAPGAAARTIAALSIDRHMVPAGERNPDRTRLLIPEVHRGCRNGRGVHTGGSLDRDLVRIVGALLEFADATAALERDHSLPLPMRIDADVALGPATIDALRHHPHAGMHFATHSVSLKGYDAPMLVSAASFDSPRRFVEGCEA